jgi:hypothetical protein
MKSLRCWEQVIVLGGDASPRLPLLYCLHYNAVLLRSLVPALGGGGAASGEQAGASDALSVAPMSAPVPMPGPVPAPVAPIGAALVIDDAAKRLLLLLRPRFSLQATQAPCA